MKRLIFTIISITILFSCSKDDPIEKTETDLSVTSIEEVVYWTNSNNINQSINDVLLFNYGNVEQSKIEKKLIFNNDSTEVSATINFKQEYQQYYYDSDLSNNTVSIKLQNENETGNQQNISNLLTSNQQCNLLTALINELPNFNFSNQNFICIPITFHIPSGVNISNTTLFAIINNLNNNFYNAKISFSLNGVNNTDPSVFYNLHLNDNINFPDVVNNLNIYIAHNIRTNWYTYVNGFSHFPTEGIERIYIRDTFLHSNNDPFSATLTHEIGHFFSLFHTFETDLNNHPCDINNVFSGDGISDTPLDEFGGGIFSIPNFFYGTECNVSDPNMNILIHNFMSYSLLANTFCNRTFTDEQNIRICFAAHKWKSDLVCQSTSSSEISISPQTLDFPDTEVNTNSQTLHFTVTNTGNSSFSITDMINSSSAFEVLNGMSTTINPNSSITFDVRFNPTQAQTYNGTIEVINDADNSNSSNSLVYLSGTGVNNNQYSEISLSGNLNFGNVEVGQSNTRTFTISNIGNQSMYVSSIVFPSNVYSANWNYGTISGNSSQTVTVTFQPTNEQSYNGTVTVNNNADSGNGNISISGNGVNNNSNTPITPTNTCNSAPVMAVNTVYEVSNFDFSQFGSAYPIDGESYQGGLVKGFYLSIQVPTTQSYKIRIFDVSSNFDPVFGVKYECNTGYYQDMNSGNIYRNDTGYGGNETFYAGNFSSSYTYNLRIYHYYGNDTPVISFKVEVIPN